MQDLSSEPSVTVTIINKAKSLGASSAGVADLDTLKRSSSYARYHESPYYDHFQGVRWPEAGKCVFVFTLVHKASDAEFDWWDPLPGGTPGNRRLIGIANGLTSWLATELNIQAIPLPYKIEKGGVFLKDAAMLAGLGSIGKNNLLITPEYGPRVRLRALFLDVELTPTGPLDFSPCVDCPMPCLRACPQRAFRDGAYRRDLCQIQMKLDEASGVVIEKARYDAVPRQVIKYCRACELSCPVGRQR